MSEREPFKPFTEFFFLYDMIHAHISKSCFSTIYRLKFSNVYLWICCKIYCSRSEQKKKNIELRNRIIQKDSPYRTQSWKRIWFNTARQNICVRFPHQSSSSPRSLRCPAFVLKQQILRARQKFLFSLSSNHFPMRCTTHAEVFIFSQRR